jgi:hypothetical protein
MRRRAAADPVIETRQKASIEWIGTISPTTTAMTPAPSTPSSPVGYNFSLPLK